ncbi:MAG: hypothetical protein GY775_20970 [Candidatus Scalindua sp.]|nr:hypothetical protein [Candidatus Scalindua sp.]
MMDCGTTDIGKGGKGITQSPIVHMESKSLFVYLVVEICICVHQRIKYTCTDCDGRQLCKPPHCPIRKNPKYNGYCWCCFTNLFPDTPVVRNYRTKETTVATFLKEKFPNVTWKCNKRVENGCSRRRPDLLDMGCHIVIVEVDEHSHDVYDPTCEEKRLGEIWGDVDHQKIVFIRFNTDEYKDEDGNNVPSPWGVNGHGVLTVRPKWKAAWEVRLDDLSWYICTTNNYVKSSFSFYSIHNHYLFQK